jgi:hypothetical protein
MTHFKSLGALRITLLAALTSFLFACGGAPAGAPAPSDGGTGQEEETSVTLGTGGGSSFSAGSLSATLISDGSNPVWEISGVVAGSNGIAVTDVYSVNFNSTCVATNLSTFSASSVQTVAGRFSISYTAGTCDGIDTVTASIDGEASSASVDLDIDAAVSAGNGGSGTQTIFLGSGGGASFSQGSLSATLVTSGANPEWEISGVVADSDGVAVTDAYTINFSSTCVSAGLSSLSAASSATNAGRVTVTYTAGACDGVDTITASVEGEPAARATADLDIDAAVTGGGPQLGNGSGTGFVSGVLAASVTSLDAGNSTTISANVVDENNVLLQDNVAVTFTSPCIESGLSALSASPVNSTNGLATTQYTAQGCSGTDVVTATAVIGGTQLSATIDLIIAVDTVLGVQFESVSESILAIAGIGGTETAVVTFQLIGSLGDPIVGEEVTFQITNSAGGASIAPGTESDESDAEGFISTVVQSGTVNSSLRVIATHSDSGVQGSSDDITISTGVAVKRSFDLEADVLNPRAANHNGIVVNFTINAADQFGNPPPDGTRVSFRSVEVGIIEPSCALENGECRVTWESSGDRDEITPHQDGRLMRATILAFMSGAENYTDFNGNGFFDAGNTSELASLQDLPEAFVDQNEDGSHNPGEDFVDSFLNNPEPTATTPGGTNGAYDDMGDDVYNGPCSEEIQDDCPLSEIQSTIISDSVVISLSSENALLCSNGNLPLAGDTVTIPMTVSGVIICDEYLNSLPSGASYTWSVTNGSLDGITTSVVPNTTEPYSTASVIVEPAPGQTSGILRLTITSENRFRVFSWPWQL